MLNKISLFGGLTADDLKEIIPMLSVRSYKKNEIVFSQGESPKNIFIIENGEVKIIIKEEDVAIELIKFSEGNLFGETELIGIFKYIASAIAITDTDLFVFSKASLYSLYSKNLKLFSKIVLNVARESCRRTATTDEYWLKEMVKLKRENQKKD